MPARGLLPRTTVDPSGKAKPENLTLDSSDLTTHGVIVGMTGSGKTGLGIVLLEEALLAGSPCSSSIPRATWATSRSPSPACRRRVPALGQRGDATAAGLSVDDYAAQTASQWQEGLEGQGIGAERIKALRDAADFTIYTPGSTAGVPLNVVGSLHAPKLSWDTEAETLRDEIEGTRHQPARPRRDRGRPAVEPRAHPALQPDRERVAGGPRPRPRLADRPGPVAAAAQARRLRARRLLPAEGPHRARPQAQRARRLAVVRGLGRRRRARRAVAALHARGQAARCDRLPRPPVRRGAAVRRHARPLEARHLDAWAARHVRPPRARRTWTRCSASSRRPPRRRRRSRS